MTYSIALAGRMIDCPIIWQQFIEKIPPEADKSSCGDISVKVINRFLKPFGGKFIEDEYPIAHLVFKKESGYTLFCLAYS